MTNIILPELTSLNMLKSLPAGLLSRFKRPFTQSNIQLVREFFQKNRPNPEKVALADASTSTFDIVIKKRIVPLCENFDQVMDLGCGSSSLELRLPSRVSYIGIDVYISNPPRRTNSRIFECDLSSGLPNDFKESGKTLFLAFNLLCYIHKPELLVKSVARQMDPADLLLVVEPSPSLIWENGFHGIRIYLRSKQQLINLLSQQGLKIVEITPVWLFSVAGQPYWRVANIIVANRAN